MGTANYDACLTGHLQQSGPGRCARQMIASRGGCSTAAQLPRGTDLTAVTGSEAARQSAHFWRLAQTSLLRTPDVRGPRSSCGMAGGEGG